MVSGNLLATRTLALLMLVSGCLVVLMILLPLARSGLPQMPLGTFLLSVTYFSIIGYAFMAAQIPFLQRFSIFLGHPIYTYSVVLFAMIFFSGIGSLISERIQPEARGWFYAIPGSIAILLLALSLSIGGIVREADQLGLVGRSMVVIGVMSPVSVLLGMCFPLGARMVSRLSDDAMPWMWGINGAFGVFASILSVAISIMAGIYVNLLISSALYLSLALVAGALRRRASY